jgi:hypothetical protein
MSTKTALPLPVPGCYGAYEKNKTGAGDGIRTRDNLLGRQGLCQLSYSRQIKAILALKSPLCQTGLVAFLPEVSL